MAHPPTAALSPELLPPGVRSRFVEGVNGLTMHVLEAGHETPGRPCVLLLHGFPELAYSWRKLMPMLADAGCHVVAPDQRGYGRTSGWNADYDSELGPFGMTNLVQDALDLVAALGRHDVAAVVGHDFGSPVAAWCALLRPDVFRSVVLMSAPFTGPPDAQDAAVVDDVLAGLAALPRPRKHYQWYYTTREANPDMWHCPQGVHAFLRAYYHVKSADWPQNHPVPLAGWHADELARMPTYYVMDLAETMADAVAREMPTPAQVAAARWLTDAELRVYSGEFERTGFQGGLQWYRAMFDERCLAEMRAHAGRTIDVPTLFIGGRSDWGVHQKPGALEAMHAQACPQLRGCHEVEGAGHWVQQERPEAVGALLRSFLERAAR